MWTAALQIWSHQIGSNLCAKLLYLNLFVLAKSVRVMIDNALFETTLNLSTLFCQLKRIRRKPILQSGPYIYTATALIM